MLGLLGCCSASPSRWPWPLRRAARPRPSGGQRYPHHLPPRLASARRHQAPVKDLLRRYVDLRLKYWPLVDDPAKLAEGMRLGGEIKAELWKHATEAAKEAPNDITATFIESLNETIDTDAERIAAMRAGIPGGVWLLLIMVAAFGCVTTSYGAGAEGARIEVGQPCSCRC